MKLDVFSTEDLVSRWEVLFEKYKSDVKDLEIFLTSFNKVRNELLMIREELQSRGISINNDVQAEPGRSFKSTPDTQ